MAEALEHAGKFEEAAQQLADIEDAIPATKYLPLTAEYLRLVGLVADDRGDSKSAEQTLTDAAWTAQRAGHDYEMARSMTDLVYVIGNHLARTDDALLWGKHADAAVERVGDEFLRARLANHIGMTLDVGARYEEALQWLGDAVGRFEKLGGPDDWNTISARAAYASALDSLGRYDESSLEQAAIVEATRRTLGPDHPDYAVTLTNQALFQIQVGQAVEAIASLETARKIFERVHGKQHPHLGAVWTNLAVAHHARDDFSATRDAMEHALKINEATLGPEHPDVANTIGNLGSVSFQLGDFPAAEAYTRRSLKLLTAAIGSDHPDVGGAWLQLGVVLRAQGRLEAAVEAGERGAAVLRAKLPSDHVELGRACVALAQTHADGEQWPQSQRYAQEALTIFEAHPAVMPWNRGKARFLEATARWAQGEREAVVDAVRKARDEVGSEDTAAGEAIETWLAEH
ncbi:MAG: tetratricopeptide repeat protein [Nannocystaceae bacterium]|nr:tetratricopeptide repeat protein [Nannocystaceae bacterium]